MNRTIFRAALAASLIGVVTATGCADPAKAKYEAAQAAEQQGSNGEAKHLYEQAASAAPSSEYGKLASKRLGEIADRVGELLKKTQVLVASDEADQWNQADLLLAEVQKLDAANSDASALADKLAAKRKKAAETSDKPKKPCPPGMPLCD